MNKIGLVGLLAMALWSVASAQSTASCMSTIISLSPCLSYITGNASTPTSSCCSQLAAVVGSKPECLCLVLDQGVPSLGITINKTQALELPGDCNVKTPPVSRCKDVTGGARSATAPSPVSLQAVSSTGQAAAPGPLSSTGQAAAPGPSSDGSSVQIPMFIIVFTLFVAVYLSTAPPDDF